MLDIIFSSDLDRAFETAQIGTQGLGLDIIKEKRLREAHFGDAEGKLLPDILTTFGKDLWDKFMTFDIDHLDLSFPNGETRRDSISRMRAVIDEIIESNKYSKVGISTHGGVVRNLLGSYLMESEGERVFDIAIPNCVVYELSYSDGVFRVSGPIE